MFSFEITPLADLFFILTLIVFTPLFFIKKKRKTLLVLLFISLSMIFYANNLITLFISWEMMTWSSYLLIAKDVKFKTAQKYIIFNLGAGFALLGAIVLIYSFTGTFIYNEIDFNQVPVLFRIPIYMLLLVAIFIKSGIIPFHHWVVDTYSQSEDIFSTILSAIISKVGVFIYIIFFVQIIQSQNIEIYILDIVAWLGVITSIIATFKAINQDDIKRLLAYSSIAQVGYIITILSILNASSLEAGLYHIVIHTFVKLLLFVNVASIIYITKKSKFSQLGGLIYKYPVLFIMLLIGIIGLAGMPPLGGFSSKFLIYTTLLEEKKSLLLVAIMFSSASAFLYCYKLIYGIYLGQQNDTIEYRKLPKLYYIPQFIGVFILIVLGSLPSLAIWIFNSILVSLGFKSTVFNTLFELNTNFASFNGGIIMAIFTIVFLILLTIITSTRSKAIKVKDKFDISYCGEIPKQNTNLHYGYSMGQEIKRISFIGYILKNSTSPYWEQIALIIKDSSILVKNLYTITISNLGIIIMIFFTILLFIGVQ
jgi:NADH-quinone oxidoreductase subunit M